MLIHGLTCPLQATKPTVAEVRAAVSALYSDPNPERRKAADQWLTALQGSDFAMEVGREVMPSTGFGCLPGKVGGLEGRQQRQGSTASAPQPFHAAAR